MLNENQMRRADRIGKFLGVRETEVVLDVCLIVTSILVEKIGEMPAVKLVLCRLINWAFEKDCESETKLH